ncbi:polysaccharide deacetylase family protein [Allofustis seminis]|uniref:polysaccharide deacetylase family protein n=1 Tax=Allofustis seminis TaxID=166939 RepID=UPI0003659508|nr:polysaccharide deacetylase family protein [Allofustis seminis]
MQARIAEVTEKTKQQDVVESDFPGIHIATYATESEDFRRFIQKPLFDEEILNAPVDDYIEEVVATFNASVTDTLKVAGLDELDMIPNLSINFEIYPFGHNLYSIVFTIHEFFGGNTQDLRTKIFLVNLNEKEMLNPKELVTEDAPEAIWHQVKEQLVAQDELADYFMEEFFDENITPEDILEKMYITEDAIHFIFDKYTVAAGAAGIPEAVFTLDDFHTHFNEAFNTMLGYIKNVPGRVAVSGADRWDHIDKPHIITHRPEAGKKVALTFDDGPHPTNTLAVLDLLAKYHAKGTFFMIGTSVNFYPDLVAKVIENGHEVGEHSWTHRDFTTLDAASIQQEFDQSDAAFHKVSPWTPTLFRPPYGAYNDAVSQAIGERHIVLWSIDTLDWQSHNPQAILEHVKNNLHDGAIILMHDVHDTSVPGLALVLEYLQSQGYEMVTVSELYND